MVKGWQGPFCLLAVLGTLLGSACFRVAAQDLSRVPPPDGLQM